MKKYVLFDDGDDIQVETNNFADVMVELEDYIDLATNHYISTSWYLVINEVETIEIYCDDEGIMIDGAVFSAEKAVERLKDYA